MLELDVSYRAYAFTPSLGLILKGGLVVNRLDVHLRQIADSEVVQTLTNSSTEVGAKVGLGIQWDFSNNWAFKAGYSHLSFLSMDKTYVLLEYRF